MDKFKVVFIGGLTNGKIVFDYLTKNRFVDLELVVTYPDDSTKPRHRAFPNSDNVIKSGKANNSIEAIQKIKPDFIFVAGWSELLDNDIVNAARLGTIGFHPSKLPFDKGRSVLAWQIEEGYSKTALTMFYYCDFPDGGDIIGQEIIKIDYQDHVNDILNKVDLATTNLIRAYFPLLRQGLAPRKKQDLNEGNFRRLRTSKDSQINLFGNAIDIYNKVRAISSPYPGAILKLEAKKYKVLNCNIVEFQFGSHAEVGTTVATLFDDTFIVKCRDSYIHITDYEEI